MLFHKINIHLKITYSSDTKGPDICLEIITSHLFHDFWSHPAWCSNECMSKISRIFCTVFCFVFREINAIFNYLDFARFMSPPVTSQAETPKSAIWTWPSAPNSIFPAFISLWIWPTKISWKYILIFKQYRYMYIYF